MREILFRGKSVDCVKEGEWVYGYYNMQRGALDDMYHDYIQAIYGWNYQVDPDTVGQFTGLLDKNGNKIFEGDIVAVFYDCKIQFDGVVQYNNGAFVIKGYSMEYLTRENMTFAVECSKWDKPEFLNS